MKKYYDYLKKYKIWILFLIIGIMIPGFTYIYDNFDKNITTNNYEQGITEEIVKGTQVTQKIYIPGKIYKFGLKFGTYSRENSGKIKITFKQNNIIVSKVVNVSELKNDNTSYIKMNFSKLKKGDAILEIEGIDGINGNAVSLITSTDISLGKLTENNITKDRGIIFDIGYYKIDKTVVLQIIFLILTTVCFLTIMKLSENERRNNKKIYFFTSAMLFFLINVKVPLFSFYAEPYAELLHNFLVNALYKKSIDNILITDFGYWPLFQRIITLIVVKIFKFNLRLTTYFLQNIGIYIITLIGSMFVLQDYKKYGNLLFRLCVSFIIGGGITLTPTVEGYYLFNISYYGIVGLILISLLDFKNLEKKRYLFLMCFSFFVCISKSHYIILIPIGIMSMIIFFKDIKIREKAFLALVILSSFLQFVYIKINSDVPPLNFNLIDIFKRVFYNFLLYFVYLVYPEVKTSNVGFLNILFFLGFIFLMTFLIYMVICYKNKESKISIILICLVFGVILLNTLYEETDKFFIFNFELLHKTGSSISRRSIFIIISFIILIVLLMRSILFLIAKKIKNDKISFSFWKKIKHVFYTIMLFIFILRFFPFDNNRKGESTSLKINEIMPDWNKYYKFFMDKDVAMPFGRYFFLTKGDVELYFIKNNKLKKIDQLDENWITNNIYRYYDIKNIDEDKEQQQIHEIIFEKDENPKYLYSERMRVNNKEKLKIVGYDGEDKEVFEITQLNRKERLFIGFKNNTNSRIKKIKFFTDNGEKAYIKDGIYLGL